MRILLGFLSLHVMLGEGRTGIGHRELLSAGRVRGRVEFLRLFEDSWLGRSIVSSRSEKSSIGSPGEEKTWYGATA